MHADSETMQQTSYPSKQNLSLASHSKFGMDLDSSHVHFTTWFPKNDCDGLCMKFVAIACAESVLIWTSIETLAC